jgi:hypothetical protein
LEHGQKYIGEWSDAGLKHGKGLFYWADGAQYEGYWKYDQLNGKGRLMYENGEIYEGNFENDLR